MNVLIFVVNYNADEYLIRFLRSVLLAQQHCDNVKVDVHVFENSQKTAQGLDLIRKQLNNTGMCVALHVSDKNTGYFGGLSLAQSLACNNTDCIIYCNPDIILESDFFRILMEKANNDAGVIAPEIISMQDGFDQNPKYSERLSKRRLRRLKLIYSNLLVCTCFIYLARIKEIMISSIGNKKKSENFQCTNIYAPHGSIFIFSNVSFFKRLPVYPCFLFAEELFIAEEARISNILIAYEPELHVLDIRHASTTLLSNKYRCTLLHKSIKYILEQYYSRSDI